MKNFGQIKNHITNSLTKSYIDKKLHEGNNIKKLLNIIKDSEILMTEFSVYQNIEKNDITSMGKEYLDANISLMKEFKSSDIISEHKKLMEAFEIKELDVVEGKLGKLYESVTNLIFLNNTVSTVNKLVESKMIVLEHFNDNDLSNSEAKKDSTPKDQKILTDLAKEKLKERYSEQLTESELKVINATVKGDEELQSKVLKELKDECLSYVNGELTESTIERKEKLLDVKSKLLDFSYNAETFKDDTNKLLSLLKGFNEE